MKIALCIDSFYPCIDGPINVTSSLASIFNRTDKCSVLAPSAKSKYVDNFSYDVIRCKSISAPENYRYALPSFDYGFRKKSRRTEFRYFSCAFTVQYGQVCDKDGKTAACSDDSDFSYKIL